MLGSKSRMKWCSRLHIRGNEETKSCYSERKGFGQSLLPAYRVSAPPVKSLDAQQIGGLFRFRRSLQYALVSMVFVLNRCVRVQSQQECTGTEVGDFQKLPVMEEDL